MTVDNNDIVLKKKLLLFHRVLISYNDFKQAREISSYILDHKLHDNYKLTNNNDSYENKILLQALNCAMIVAYCRPFSGNDKKVNLKIPDLPRRFFNNLTKEEKEVHKLVVEDRNSVLAHSDSSAWDLNPVFIEMSGQKLLEPIHNDIRAPLTKDTTIEFNNLCKKLMEDLFGERKILEKELGDKIETIPISNKEKLDSLYYK